MPSPKGTNRERMYLPASWATKGGVASEYYRMALDSAANLKPRASSPSRRTRLVSFEQMYGVRLGPRGETIALDQEMVRRGGNVIAPNGQPCPEVLEDHDPAAQHLVETTDAEPPAEHEIRGRAPPWGPSDLPTNRSVTEPNPNIATDPPVSERQRRAMYSAARGESKIGIPASVGRHFIEDQAEVELPSEEEHKAHSVAQAQQDQLDPEAEREVDEKFARHLLRDHGFSIREAADVVLRARAARDRARKKARDQGPPSFPGRPSAFEGSPNAKLAGDSASFLRMYPDAARLTSHSSGAMVITAKTHVHRSRG
jgi:hypothetical protein